MTDEEEAELLRNLAAIPEILATWPERQRKTNSTCVVHKLPSRKQMAAVDVENWYGLDDAGRIFR